MNAYHKSLSRGGWQNLSLFEQLGNIGSEVSRARIWQNRDSKIFQGSIERAFELMDLTIGDPRWRSRLKEITRARECLVDAIGERKFYDSSLEGMERYFFAFALAARIDL